MVTSYSNYPPDYEAIKHLIDDPVDDILLEELDEYDDSDFLEDFVSTKAEDPILAEVPLFDGDE